MIPLLAQLSPDAMPALVTFLIGGSAVMFLLNQALTFYKSHMKEQPAPANTYATKEELRQAHGRIEREKKELETKIAALAQEDLRLRQKLDTDIEELNARIDSVPERTIKLLRDTKGLLT